MALLSFDGDNAYKKYAETSISKKFKLVPLKSIKIEGGEVSQYDTHFLAFLLKSFGSFTLDICGDIYSGLGILLKYADTLVLGDVEKYGVCILIKGGGEFGKNTHTCLLDPKKYGKDLNTSYYLRVYAEASDLDVTNDYRFLVDKKRAVEYGEDTNLIATKPYIEETYDTHGNLIGAKLYGHTKIRYQAFQGCASLAHISLPESLTSIDGYAFENCTSLALTSLPESLRSIGSYTFKGCRSLALTSLPNGITSIDENAFQVCTSLALTSLPEGITSISNSVFKGCTSLALISLPNGIMSIGEYAFQDCTSLALTSLPESLRSIGEHAFEYCTSLALTSLPENLMFIDGYAFESCTSLALTSFPESLRSIADGAFENCTSLALTSLPESLRSIGSYAFKNCTGLTSITFKGTPTTISSTAFNGCTNLTDIKVPWAKGAVINAPWGATNATITYNYTGE